MSAEAAQLGPLGENPGSAVQSVMLGKSLSPLVRQFSLSVKWG